MSKLLTAVEVADKLRVSVRYVETHSAPGWPEETRIPSVKVGHYRRFNEAEIDAWIARGCKPEGNRPKIRRLKVVSHK